MAGQPHTASEPLGVMCRTSSRAQFTPLPSPADALPGLGAGAPRVLPGVFFASKSGALFTAWLFLVYRSLQDRLPSQGKQ